MYWYINLKNIRKRSALLAIGAAVFLMGCESTTDKAVAKQTIYFNIPGYFEDQVTQLQKLNPLVLKTVYTNEISEQKELKIASWNSELSSFLSVDLNKPAYQGYIVKDSSDNIVNYTFTKDKADVSKVTIKYKDNTPVEFEITKQVKNFLYKTDEKLIYQTDKNYSIEKSQKVILLGANDYKIIGEIK